MNQQLQVHPVSHVLPEFDPSLRRGMKILGSLPEREAFPTA